jgi:hypothetical protein
MDPATLKRLGISSQKTFDDLVRWGWINPSGEPVFWDRIVNRKGFENMSRDSVRLMPAPYAKNREERRDYQR